MIDTMEKRQHDPSETLNPAAFWSAAGPCISDLEFPSHILGASERGIAAKYSTEYGFRDLFLFLSKASNDPHWEGGEEDDIPF